MDNKNSFTFNFNAPVGQNIAHADKVIVHFDKDMKMQILDTDEITDNDDEEDSDESKLISCIETLMSEKESNGDWLVSQGNHWIAIFRIVVDKNLGVSESDYTGFCNMIDRIKRKEFRIPLKLDNIKKITDSNYTQPFDRWRFKTSYCKTRRPFDKMFSVAKRFKEILENNGF